MRFFSRYPEDGARGQYIVIATALLRAVDMRNQLTMNWASKWLLSDKVNTVVLSHAWVELQTIVQAQT